VTGALFGRPARVLDRAGVAELENNILSFSLRRYIATEQIDYPDSDEPDGRKTSATKVFALIVKPALV
jgi:hypothetical protein